jgi:6-phosphogluconolactonase (cycloisomerase 2 family)
MLRNGRRGLIFGLAVVVLLGASRDDKGQGRLALIESEPRDDLDGVVSVTVSSDGKFLYGASWKGANVNVFKRDVQSGKLNHVQTINDADSLAGTTGISLSPDGKFAVASAFQSKTVVLFQRNPETGDLTVVDVARHGENGVQLGFPIDAAFSLDSKFVYAVDDNGPGESGQGSVAAFRVNGAKLEFVALDEGMNGCYQGARGIAFHPDGKTVFITCNDAGTLAVANRDPETGKTSVRQVLRDEEDDVHGLAGAMSVAVSPDGKFVYVSAGRFHGDNTISAFQLNADGRLKVLEEFHNGQGEFQGFEGGNHLTISPDGLNLYAAGTRSGSVASFRRDRETGKLKYLDVIPDGGDGGELGAAGVCVSPDGQFVYIATEDKKSISIFKRDTEK